MDVLKKLDENIYISIDDALSAVSNHKQTKNSKFEEGIRL